MKRCGHVSYFPATLGHSSLKQKPSDSESECSINAEFCLMPQRGFSDSETEFKPLQSVMAPDCPQSWPVVQWPVGLRPHE